MRSEETPEQGLWVEADETAAGRHEQEDEGSRSKRRSKSWRRCWSISSSCNRNCMQLISRAHTLCKYYAICSPAAAPYPLHTLPLFPPHSLLPCLPAASQAALAAIGVCIRRKSAEADASPTHDKCLLYISAGGAAAGKGAGKE